MSAPRREPWRWYALLVAPFVATLCVPFYDRAEPSLGGIPFFYWYLFLWVVLTAALSGVVYFAIRVVPAGGAGPTRGPGTSSPPVRVRERTGS